MIVSLMVVGVIGGPLSAVAGANPVDYIKRNGVPKSGCEWQEALGIYNVRECEENS